MPNQNLTIEEMRAVRTGRQQALQAFFSDLVIDPNVVRYARFSADHYEVFAFETDDDSGKRIKVNGSDTLECAHSVHSIRHDLSVYGEEVKTRFLRTLGALQDDELLFLNAAEIIIVDGSIRIFYVVQEKGPQYGEFEGEPVFLPGPTRMIEANLLFTQADLDRDEKNAQQAERLFSEGSAFGPAATRSSEERVLDDFRRELDGDAEQE